MSHTLAQRLSSHLEHARQCDQHHLVDAAKRLDEADQATFVQSLDAVPWDECNALRAMVTNSASSEQAVAFEPPSSLSVEAAVASGAQAKGEALLKRGAVAVFTVAGGQGTRLGWNGPKGTFPATPITGKPLFALLAERISAAAKRYGAPVRWYIMTSEENDAATRSFFQDNRFFGLDRSLVQLFPQGMMPAFDAVTGQLLMGGPDRLALSPDGHGGSFRALLRSGALEHMERRGVEVVSYVQIDNPLVRAIDPVFLGMHVDPAHSSGELSSKIVGRAHAGEKVGVFVDTPQGMSVCEYSDLGQEMAGQTDDAGELRWRAANIAVHALGVGFIRKMADGGTRLLPWHLAKKRVPVWCPNQRSMIEPAAKLAPNAVKFERFVFDALPAASRPLLLEVQRSEEFAPIKNADGEDSATSSARMQIALHASWLTTAGVNVPRTASGDVHASIEISPVVAQWPEDLEGVQLPDAIEPGGELLLESR
jgi:UDP-N-acetylglucosamine/UDP-N-acetylgalactosamine diphosphorylase